MRVYLILVALLHTCGAYANEYHCGQQLLQATGIKAAQQTVDTIIQESPITDSHNVLILAAIESAFRPDARSNKGAYGLMQVTLPAAQQVQIITQRYKKLARNLVLSPQYVYYVKDWLQHCDLPTPSEKTLLNPRWSVRYGSCYLQYLLRESGGNLPQALAGYNGGFAQAAKMERHQNIHVETANYIAKFYFLRALATSCQQGSDL